MVIGNDESRSQIGSWLRFVSNKYKEMKNELYDKS
jgi:hypothetical protein